MRLATVHRSTSGDRYSGLSGSFALLTTSLIWGVTFVILKVTVETIPPFSLAFGKFGIALALLLVVSWNKLRHNWRACLPASACSLWLSFSSFAYVVIILEINQMRVDQCVLNVLVTKCALY